MSTATEPRDLNRNGKIDIYEDPTASIDDRIEDLLCRLRFRERVVQPEEHQLHCC